MMYLLYEEIYRIFVPLSVVMVTTSFYVCYEFVCIYYRRDVKINFGTRCYRCNWF